MRGGDARSGALFSYVDLEARIGSRDDRKQSHWSRFEVGCGPLRVNICPAGRVGLDQLLTITRDNLGRRSLWSQVNGDCGQISGGGQLRVGT